MEKKTPQEIQEALARPFAPEDLEWRLQTVLEGNKGIAVPYVTNRAIQSRLDSVVGMDRWSNTYQPWHRGEKREAQICGISIYFEERGWITKWDGAEDSDIESIKGGLSDSMKRAAVQWGIGRCLYGMDVVFVEVEKRGKATLIKRSERPRLDSTYCSYLKRIGLTYESAGGTQSQLVDKPLPADKTSSRSTKTTSNGTQQTTQLNDAAEYTVKKASIQKGKNGISTSLTLVDASGKTALGFIRGAHPEIKAGVQLSNVKKQIKQQDSVVFYLLDSFEIAATGNVA